MTHSLIILIPSHKPHLSEDECISVNRLLALCPHRNIAFVCPNEISSVTHYEHIPVIHFDSRFFTSLQAYNSLMMQEDFYRRFQSYTYILICQTDAFLFRDELDRWCECGYSYVGAPWIQKRKYHGFKRILLYLRALPKRLTGKPFLPLDRENLVGNGGLSLRKVEDFLQVCQTEKKVMQQWLEKSVRYPEYNEDCFWATRPSFRYPTCHEALTFAFDLGPKDAYEQNHRQLPMGCHGWSKSKYKPFWMPHIRPFLPQ